MKKEIRPYQAESVLSIEENLKKGTKNLLLVLATGTGKTFTAVKAISQFNFERVLWLTHTEELISQSAFALLDEEFAEQGLDAISFRKEFSDIIEFKDLMKQASIWNLNTPEAIFANRTLGIIKAEHMDINCPITMASIQSMHRRLDKFKPDEFDCIIIDEAHMALAPTWSKTINYFKPKLTLGLTATPYRGDNMALSNLFDKISYEYPIEQGIKEQYLCELDAVRVKTDLDLDSVRTTAGELNSKDLQIVNTPKRNNLIVDSYEKYAKGRQSVAFCVDVKHAMDLSQTFQNRGYRANFVVGDDTLTTDRKGVIQSLKSGQLDVLTNCMVLTAGFDYPELSCIIMACPTKSKTKFVQCIGRGTRLKQGEFKDTIILDVVDNTKRHQLVNTDSIDKEKKIEDRIFLTKKKKDLLIKVRNERKFKPETKKDEKISLFKLPKIEIKYSGRNLEPATEKQLQWIASLGYDIKEVEYTKAMASEIISNLPATDAQLWRLNKEGYDVSEGATYAQASEAMTNPDKYKGKTSVKIPVPPVSNNVFNDLF